MKFIYCLARMLFGCYNEQNHQVFAKIFDETIRQLEF